MVRNARTSSHRGIVLLGRLALALIIGGGVCLIGYAWMAVDNQEAIRETALVRRSLARSFDRIIDETLTGTAWDEAYIHTSSDFSPVWFDRHLLTYYRDSFGHNLTLVFDSAGALRYAAHDGRRTDPALDASLARAVTPLVTRVREQEMQRRHGREPPDPRATGNLAWLPAVIHTGGRLYLVGVSTIAPTNGIVIGDKPAAVAVSGKRVDQSFLNTLQADLGIRDLRLVAKPGYDLGMAALPAGAGALVWSPAKPGIDVLRKAGGTIAVIALLLGLTMTALAWRMRQLFARIRSDDQALQSTMIELVEARDLAQAASAAAQEASIAKSQFIANISHEIRTPLNGVLGMAQVMVRDELTPRQLERARTIVRAGNALLTVLNDVLDISKVEAGKLEINHAVFDMGELIYSVCESYVDAGAAKGVPLTWTLAPEIEGTWSGDPVRIRQILLNLISNAIKFTEAGAVRIEATADPSAGHWVQVAVRDQGIGVPAEKLPHLFEKFSQVDGSATRRFGGTGLGLAISRELALLMGGDVLVESLEGVGSTFTLALPLSRAEAAQTPPDKPGAELAPSCPDRRLRILVAEDNQTNQMILGAMLEPYDAELVVVANGAEAVEAFEAGGFDLVLMDVQMPVMNGVEATRAIRSMECDRGAAPTPIVALTANAMQHQIAEYYSAGMSDHVAKPIQMDRLLDAIGAAL